jgi:hypothetical protein
MRKTQRRSNRLFATPLGKHLLRTCHATTVNILVHGPAGVFSEYPQEVKLAVACQSGEVLDV